MRILCYRPDKEDRSEDTSVKEYLIYDRSKDTYEFLSLDEIKSVYANGGYILNTVKMSEDKKTGEIKKRLSVAVKPSKVTREDFYNIPAIESYLHRFGIEPNNIGISNTIRNSFRKPDDVEQIYNCLDYKYRCFFDSICLNDCFSVVAWTIPDNCIQDGKLFLPDYIEGYDRHSFSGTYPNVTEIYTSDDSISFGTKTFCREIFPNLKKVIFKNKTIIGISRAFMDSAVEEVKGLQDFNKLDEDGVYTLNGNTLKNIFDGTTSTLGLDLSKVNKINLSESFVNTRIANIKIPFVPNIRIENAVNLETLEITDIPESFIDEENTYDGVINAHIEISNCPKLKEIIGYDKLVERAYSNKEYVTKIYDRRGYSKNNYFATFVKCPSLDVSKYPLFYFGDERQTIYMTKGNYDITEYVDKDFYRVMDLSFQNSMDDTDYGTISVNIKCLDVETFEPHKFEYSTGGLYIKPNNLPLDRLTVENDTPYKLSIDMGNYSIAPLSQQAKLTNFPFSHIMGMIGDKYGGSNLTNQTFAETQVQDIDFTTDNMETYMSENTLILYSYAFAGNTQLKSIKFAKNLDKIDAYAFKNCSNLETVHIPANVDINNIHEYAFVGCPKIQIDRADIQEKITKANSNVQKAVNTNAMVTAMNLTKLLDIETVDADIIVKGISNRELLDRQQILNIPIGVTTVGEYNRKVEISNYYSKCEQLKKIVVPTSVRKLYVQGIPVQADLILQEGLMEANITYMDSRSYYSNNEDVENKPERVLKFPHTLKRLEINTLPEGIKLEFNDELEYLDCRLWHGYQGRRGTSARQSKHLEFKELTLPKNIKELGYHFIYANTSFESITLNDSLEEISRNAFDTVMNITELTIPANCKLNEESFVHMNGLEVVRFHPDYKLRIPYKAFRYCPKLKEVYLPYGVEADEEAFPTKTKRIYYDKTLEQFDKKYFAKDFNFREYKDIELTQERKDFINANVSVRILFAMWYTLCRRGDTEVPAFYTKTYNEIFTTYKKNFVNMHEMQKNGIIMNLGLPLEVVDIIENKTLGELDAFFDRNYNMYMKYVYKEPVKRTRKPKATVEE